MEALGAAASVAGILSLVGQSIDGIIKLRGFVKDVKNSPKTLGTFLHNVDSFHTSLSQIQQLLNQLPEEQPIATTQLDLQTLNWQLEACAGDIKQWLDLSRMLDLKSSSAIEAFFKKLRVAANKDGFSEFHNQIARHQRGLNISLSVLGPSLSLLGLSHIESLSSQFTTFDEKQSGREIRLTQAVETSINRLPTQESISSAICEKVDPIKTWMESSIRSPLAEQLERVETSTFHSFNYSRDGYHETRAISDSISSIGSQLSQQSQQIQEMRALLLDRIGASKSYYKPLKFSCGALLGIEQAFISDGSRVRCIYCNESFYTKPVPDPEFRWRKRARHLVDVHAFNECDLEICYETSDAFFMHLLAFHSANNPHRGAFKNVARTTGAPSRLSIDFVSAPSLEDLGQWPKEEYNIGASANQARDTTTRDLGRAYHRLSKELSDGRGNFQSESSQSAWKFLSEMHWQMCCIQERCIVNEIEFLPDLAQVLTNEETESVKSSLASSLSITHHIYQSFVRQLELHCPTGTRRLIEHQTMLHSIIDKLENQISEAIPVIVRNVGLDVYWHHVEYERWIVSDRKAEIIPRTQRINDWLLHILGASNTSKVLISCQQDIEHSQTHSLLLWMLRNIAYWSTETPDDDSWQVLSDGAIDSRDNLASERCSQSSDFRNNRDYCVPPPLPPPRHFENGYMDLGMGYTSKAPRWGRVSSPVSSDSRLRKISLSDEPPESDPRRRSDFQSSLHQNSQNPSQSYDRSPLQRQDDHGGNRFKRPRSRSPSLTPRMRHNGSRSSKLLKTTINQLGFFVCRCCPQKPMRFDAPQRLSAHEQEKQYGCKYCTERFKSPLELERHQNSQHLGPHSWSCAHFSGYAAAFHPTATLLMDVCGYCGELFPRSHNSAFDDPQSNLHLLTTQNSVRINHLKNVHRFGTCHPTKKFFHADHFYQHLKYSHAATRGPWTNKLEDACMREERLSDPINVSGVITEDTILEVPYAQPLPKIEQAAEPHNVFGTISEADTSLQSSEPHPGTLSDVVIEEASVLSLPASENLQRSAVHDHRSIESQSLRSDIQDTILPVRLVEGTVHEVDPLGPDRTVSARFGILRERYKSHYEFKRRVLQSQIHKLGDTPDGNTLFTLRAIQRFAKSIENDITT